MNLANLAEQNLEQFGTYERLVFEGRRYTNAELHAQSMRLAGALRALGLQPGDRVVVLLTNRAEVLVSYAAIWRLGCVAVPVLFLLEARELAFVAQNSGARCLITAAELWPKVCDAVTHGAAFEHALVTDAELLTDARCVDFGQCIAAGKEFGAAVPRAPEDLAVLLYTSGTTGRPKGVMQTHGNLVAATQNAQASGRKTRPEDVGLLVLPLAHSFGLGVAVGGYLFGGKSVLMRWFEAGQVFKLIEEHRVTGMAGVPSMYIAMLHHPDAAAADTSSVERWLVGAAPMPTEQLARFEERFGGTMSVGYGLTEACPGIAIEREGMPRKPGSTGVAMHGVEVQIIDDAGVAVPAGELGEVIARGKNISPGYLGLAEETSESFRDGWLHTGDIGYLDREGYLFIVERKKDLIIRGGFNVYPKDVEEVLHQLPDVVECAVVGVLHPRLGESVVAYVVQRAGAELSEQGVIEHTQAHLAKYKTPARVVFCASLPKNGVGKIMKKELRRLASADANERAAGGDV